jgi:hypothetical protein
VRTKSSSAQGVNTNYAQDERKILTEDEIAGMNAQKRQILFKVGDLPAVLDDKYWPLENPKMVAYLKECGKYNVDEFMENYAFSVSEENIVEKERNAFMTILENFCVGEEE